MLIDSEFNFTKIDHEPLWRNAPLRYRVAVWGASNGQANKHQGIFCCMYHVDGHKMRLSWLARISRPSPFNFLSLQRCVSVVTHTICVSWKRGICPSRKLKLHQLARCCQTRIGSSKLGPRQCCMTTRSPTERREKVPRDGYTARWHPMLGLKSEVAGPTTWTLIRKPLPPLNYSTWT